MKKKLFLVIFILALFSMFFQFKPVQAGLTGQINSQYNKAAETGGMGQASDPRKIVEYAIFVILGTVGMVFLVLVVYGSYNLITASGDEEKVKKALSTIRPAIVGFIIIMMAYSITLFIASRVQQSVVEGTQVQK